jgi:hypothetical protein
MKKKDFPPEVLAVKETLQKKQDHRLETMLLLTETRPEEIYIDELKAMWNKLSEYSGEFTTEDSWVYAFLNMTDKFRNLPKYFLMNNAERNETIERIEGATKTLIQIYTELENTSFVGALKSTADQAIKELNETKLKGKAGGNARAIKFTRLLANHNLEMFREDLRPVIRTAVFAIYGVDYELSDIYNNLYR